jgi:hypothetical protein
MTSKDTGNVAGYMAGLIKLAGFAVLAAALVAMNPSASLAQTGAAVDAPASSSLVVPTTKLLAIGSFTGKATPDLWKPILASEMRETARLYLAGKIDQWYVKQDQSGVVFVMNLTVPKEALELLGKLPLGKAGLMEFQIIPLGPLSPMRSLLTEPTK